MRHGCLIHAVGRVRSQETTTKQKTNSRRTQKTPPDHCSTASASNSRRRARLNKPHMRYPIPVHFCRRRVCINRSRTTLATSTIGSRQTVHNRRTDNLICFVPDMNITTRQRKWPHYNPASSILTAGSAMLRTEPLFPIRLGKRARMETMQVDLSI